MIFTNTEWVLIAAWFVTLMLAVWTNHRRGFVKGANGGYMAGVYHTIEWMKKRDLITGTYTDLEDGEERPATIDELTVYVRTELDKAHLKMKEQGY
jgi:hypothetical protein